MTITCKECDATFDRSSADVEYTAHLTEPDSISMREVPGAMGRGTRAEAVAEFHLDVQVSFQCPECGEDCEENWSGETYFEVELNNS